MLLNVMQRLVDEDPQTQSREQTAGVREEGGGGGGGGGGYREAEEHPRAGERWGTKGNATAVLHCTYAFTYSAAVPS